jgi:hypothetical protein
VGQEWAVLWMATNNNGGTTYFIPMKVVDVCPDDNVRKCIIDTHGGIAYEEWKRDTPKTP